MRLSTEFSTYWALNANLRRISAHFIAWIIRKLSDWSSGWWGQHSSHSVGDLDSVRMIKFKIYLKIPSSLTSNDLLIYILFIDCVCELAWRKEMGRQWNRVHASWQILINLIHLFNSYIFLKCIFQFLVGNMPCSFLCLANNINVIVTS